MSNCVGKGKKRRAPARRRPAVSRHRTTVALAPSRYRNRCHENLLQTQNRTEGRQEGFHAEVWDRPEGGLGRQVGFAVRTSVRTANPTSSRSAIRWPRRQPGPADFSEVLVLLKIVETVGGGRFLAEDGAKGVEGMAVKDVVAAVGVAAAAGEGAPFVAGVFGVAVV